MKEKKSYLAGWALSVLFGPLGAMYGCWWSGLGLFGVVLIFGLPLASLVPVNEELLGLFVVWFGGVCLALLDVTLNIFQHNQKADKHNAAILEKEAKEERSRQELLDAIKSLQKSAIAIPEEILSVARLDDTPPEEVRDDSKITCRSCERQYDGTKRFCPFCGTSTTLSPQPTIDQAKLKPDANFKISNGLGLAISLSVLAFVAIAAIWAGKKNATARNDTTMNGGELHPLQQSYAPSTKELPIPRSTQGDKGRYYLLDMQKTNGTIKALHKRVGLDSIGFTETEIDCVANQYRELGYSEISPEAIQENPSPPWTALVAGSSKSDLVLFVCNIAKTKPGGENQIIQTEDQSSVPPVVPEKAKWDECSEKIFKPYFEKGFCGSGGCRDENGKNVYPKVLRKCGPDPAL